MKTIKKMKLSQLSNAELGKKELNKLKGGGCCLCGCAYVNSGGSSTVDNAGANNSGGLQSAGGWANGNLY